MRHHEHIREEERIQIEAWRRAGWTQAKMAAELARPVRTIEKELARNGGASVYRAGAAQARALLCRKKPRRTSKLAFKPLVALIERRLKKKWSPEEISGEQARKHASGSNRYISFQHLYRVIRARQKAGDTLWSSLLRQAHRRFRRQGGHSRFMRIRNPKGLDQRPAEAVQRTHFGHFESDSLRIRGQAAGLATHVDRATGFTVLARLADCGTSAYTRATRNAFARLGLIPELKSMTVDHGMEFAGHVELERALGGIPVCFAPPHQPWMRGTNENTNGLLRGYFPKTARFDTLTQKQVDAAQHGLNTRPRKRFGFLRPTDMVRLLQLRRASRGVPPTGK